MCKLLYTHYSASLNVNILYNYGTLAKTKILIFLYQ